MSDYMCFVKMILSKWRSDPLVCFVDLLKITSIGSGDDADGAQKEANSEPSPSLRRSVLPGSDAGGVGGTLVVFRRRTVHGSIPESYNPRAFVTLFVGLSEVIGQPVFLCLRSAVSRLKKDLCRVAAKVTRSRVIRGTTKDSTTFKMETKKITSKTFL